MSSGSDNDDDENSRMSRDGGDGMLDINSQI